MNERELAEFTLGPSTIKIGTILPRDLWIQFSNKCADFGRKKNAVLAELMRAWLDQP